MYARHKMVTVKYVHYKRVIWLLNHVIMLAVAIAGTRILQHPKLSLSIISMA